VKEDCLLQLLVCRLLRPRSVTCARSLFMRRNEWKPADESTTRCASNAAFARTLSSEYWTPLYAMH